MAEIRETEVARDRNGRVVGYRERIHEDRAGGGGFGWGLLLGVLLILIGVSILTPRHPVVANMAERQYAAQETVSPYSSLPSMRDDAQMNTSPVSQQ